MRKLSLAGQVALLILFAVSSLAALPGCSASKDLWARVWGSSTPGDDESPNPDRDLAQKAQERLDASDYKEAAELFQQLRDQYPQSPYAPLAQLKLGDAYYLDGKYEEAYAAYNNFTSNNFESDALPYAYYQKGMCFYQRMNGIDHDQSPANKAIQEFDSLVTTFPESKFAFMGQARIAEAQNLLAGHEFYVGEFYYKRKDYAAAMRRFKGLIKSYPDSGYHQKAFNYIAEYQDLLARGEIDEGNQRPPEYNNPFTVLESSALPF
ncbi:MAG: outer membrane protein assembly factor BamD [Deltaproteobacteria bacterium]|nr:outer membrane protein assembly factor BamD [Deltaproteobacteria bacterium]